MRFDERYIKTRAVVSDNKLIVFYVLLEVVKVAIMNIAGYSPSVIEGNRGDVIFPAV
jgi:hypothetical protein